MKPSRRRFLRLGAGAATLPAVGRAARAQAYPTRPITIIVPFPPGGISDVMARLMAEPMRAFLGQPVIIENVGGAAGTIGVGRAVRAAPDGYTLSIGTTSSHVLTGALYALRWDLVKDLEPLAPLVSEPLMIVGRKGIPAQNLTELIAWLRANPDKASQGTAGVGNVGHIAGLFFQHETSTHFQFVPYRGGGPALQDLLAGNIDLEMEPSSNFIEQLRAGNLKGYAVAAGPDWRPRRTCQASTKRACRGSIDRYGSGFGCPREHQERSPAGCTPPCKRRSPTRKCAHGLPSSGRRYFRASSRRPKRLPLFRRQRSRNGGR
jgi:tripartite-type tricarboxylate transporter receptor subunit TctC